MLRRTLFLLALAGTAFGFAVAQQPPAAANPSPASDPQAQSKPDAQAKPGAQSKPAEPNVLILKAPQAPPMQQSAPQLRAVDLENRPKLTNHTRLQLIQLLDAEFVHVRKYLPLGDKSVVINPQGQVNPSDPVLFQQVQLRGAAAKLGDRVQITSIAIHEKSITFQINGGAKRK